MFLLHDRPPAALGADTAARRAADVLVAGGALLLLWPLLVLIGLLIRTTSPGSAIYRQRRVGRAGTTFMIWKFRTMTVDAAARGPAVSGRADPRITGVGRLLRNARLDELPQLVNVLRGEMTLIGPRPEVPRFVAHYTPAERQQLLAVRPGVIGPGALLCATEQSGELDSAADADDFYIRHHLHPKLTLDAAYLADRRIARDLRLICANSTPQVTGSITPCRTAMAAASSREWAPSLVSVAWTWLRMVVGATPIRRAIAAVPNPWTINSRQSCSRAVRKCASHSTSGLALARRPTGGLDNTSTTISPSTIRRNDSVSTAAPQDL